MRKNDKAGFFRTLLELNPAGEGDRRKPPQSFQPRLRSQVVHLTIRQRLSSGVVLCGSGRLSRAEPKD